ncbi:hypothetical protein STSO111631_02710 [Stackebrandtia soli]
MKESTSSPWNGLVGVILGVLVLSFGFSSVTDTYEFDGREVKGSDYCYDLSSESDSDSNRCEDVAELKETNVGSRICVGLAGGGFILGGLYVMLAPGRPTRPDGHPTD